GIAKAKERGIHFGRKRELTAEKIAEIKSLRQSGITVHHLRDGEFNVTVIPNQGSGAAAMRIEAVRRLFPKMWFNESATEAGRDALGYYHERRSLYGLWPETRYATLSRSMSSPRAQSSSAYSSHSSSSSPAMLDTLHYKIAAFGKST